MKDLTLSNLIGTLRSTFKIGKATFDASGVATARSIVVPDKAGTLALTSDITSILSVLNQATTVIQVPVSNRLLSVLNHAGATINVPA